MTIVKTLSTTLLLALTYACSHPIEILGEGDVLSDSGTRNCSLEDFSAGKENCSKNTVIGQYQESYTAVQRSGWKFDRWLNYCTDALSNECSFNVPAAVVKQNWGTTAPPLIAKFTECGASFFPSFAYDISTHLPSGGLYLASEDGCRRENVPGTSGELRGWSMHRSTDGSVGVLVWTEDGNKTVSSLMRKIGFTIADGILTWDDGGPSVIQDEQVTDPDVAIHYGALDVWGNADHSALYLIIKRTLIDDNFNRLNGSPEYRIYNLNASIGDIDYRTIAPWNCPTTTYPEMAPSCYSIRSLHWNPSGTHLYMEARVDASDGARWGGMVRVQVDRGTDRTRLADWVLSSPELVYTGTTDQTATIGSAARAIFRPGGGPELLQMDYEDRTGQYELDPRGRVYRVLNADQCARVYAGLSSGTVAGSTDLWLQCIDQRFTVENEGRPRTWQSPDSLIIKRLKNGKYTHLYRYFVTGASKGRLELLIENADFADGGL